MLEEAFNELKAAMTALAASLRKYLNLLEQWKSVDWAKKMKQAQKDLESAIKTARDARNELHGRLIKFKKDNAGAMDDATVQIVEQLTAVIESTGKDIKSVELILRDTAPILEA